jgi:hypothetical protein
VFKSPFELRFSALSDVLRPALREESIAIASWILWVFRITPALDETILKTLGIGLAIVSFPVCDMRIPKRKLGITHFVEINAYLCLANSAIF